MKNRPRNTAEYRRLNSAARWEVKSLTERREEQYVGTSRVNNMRNRKKALSC
jgi:hypothetical protein